jgi:hypothetical protein
MNQQSCPKSMYINPIFNDMKNGTTIVISAVTLMLVAYFIYFVSNVSSTYAPIKQYEYPGSLNQLISNIHSKALIDSSITFKITDKVGSKENGYATYMNIELESAQGHIEYNIKCEETTASANSHQTTISLVEAYDKTRNSGGYSKEAKGISPLVAEFELNVIEPLHVRHLYK